MSGVPRYLGKVRFRRKRGNVRLNSVRLMLLFQGGSIGEVYFAVR